MANDDFSSVFNPDHDDSSGFNFFKIWRFLMAPVCDRVSTAPTPAAGTPARTVHGSGFFDHMDANGNAPAAMERSLKQADKPVVLLCPVVNGSDYGTAITAQLAEMSRVALACLHSMGMLMRDDANKVAFSKLKRLGVAGFSFGGSAMWTALKNAVTAANQKGGPPNRIQEIYVFDANGWRAKQSDPSDILMTASQTGDLRLRVVAVTSQHGNLASFPNSSKLKASAHPDFTKNPDVFDLAKTTKPGGNPNINEWYLHFTKVQFDKLGAKWFTKIGAGGGIPDEGTWDRGARHQFAVFGGEDVKVGETFFCRFLKDSGF